jgi:hypothetical protein
MRSWRKLTWFILVVQGLFIYWISAGTASISDSCTGLTGDDLSICEAGTAIGAGLGIGLIIFLWAAADIILGIVWLITNRKSRSCPTCGKDVKKGLTACKSCGYDFATSTNHLKA